MDAFTPLTAEALSWYVYLLSDPAGPDPFYVGKGTGNRAFAHALDARDHADHPELQGAKARKILEIEAAGRQVKVEILRHGITTEKQAYEIEAAAIDLVNRLAPNTLLNVVLGHHHTTHGLMPAEELEILYAAQPAPRPEVPILLVSLARFWYRDIPEDELREYTTRWWNARGARRDRVQYMMGVHDGVVRSVYRPVNWRARKEGDRDWEDDLGKPPRWGCDGEPAPEMQHFLRTSVKRFLTQQWSHVYIGPNHPAADPAPPVD